MSASQEYSVPSMDSILSAIAAAVRLVHRLQCPAGTGTTLFVGAPWGRPRGALSHSAGLAVDQHGEVGQRHCLVQRLLLPRLHHNAIGRQL
jgi:hypothetical protein